jgi:hypothetical protein
MIPVASNGLFNPILMRKSIAILILFNIFTAGYSQVIKGKVMDSNTQAGIDFAAVYFSGTSQGTFTNQKGYFELDISLYKSLPLTISALGYYSVSLTNISYNKPYFIYLSPKEYELSEVVITAKSNPLKRRINLNTFKREFLGTTPNARSCYLENENDIMLTFKPESDTLVAFSSNPIIIYNRALGYKIIYYLDKFEYCSSEDYLKLLGQYIFIADTTNFINLQEQFDKKRKNAYLGSRMHFFRSLWENNLDQAGFVIKDYAGVRLPYEKIVTQIDSLNGSIKSKYIKYPGKLFVFYHSVSLSQIDVIKDGVYFTENGYFDPLGIFWQGEMAKTRIGDLLPFEYETK